MKTYCKHVNVEDPEFLKKVIAPAMKWRKSDYQRFIQGYSDKTLPQIRLYCEQTKTPKAELFAVELSTIANEMAQRIRGRDLRLEPIRHRNKYDPVAKKTRDIGILSIMQQLMETAATGALKDLYKARIMPRQYASIKGRGQVKGAKALAKAARKDQGAARCAAKYGTKHAASIRYYRKADVRHCYQSIDKTVLFSYLDRDIHKNKTLLWFVKALLANHGEGLAIGSPLSKDLCNYLLSFAYREVLSSRKERRGKAVPLIRMILFYMDDIFLSGSGKRDVRMAARQFERWMHDTLHLQIKPGNVKDIRKEPIDMMGYVIHENGKVTIRKRIYKRARRSFRAPINPKQARRMEAYKGYFMHSDSFTAKKRLCIRKTDALASKIISLEVRRCNTLHTEASSREST